jgi:Rrf2 family protein
MKLSTRARYGLRLMFSLAMHGGKGPLQLSEIAARENISEKYLGQIVIHLRARGLVNSVRGAQGGYYLSRDPKDITVLEIVECLEGDLSIVDCTDHPDACTRESGCAAADIWKLLSSKIRETLAAVNLADMVRLHFEKSASPDFKI